MGKCSSTRIRRNAKKKNDNVIGINNPNVYCYATRGGWGNIPLKHGRMFVLWHCYYNMRNDEIMVPTKRRVWCEECEDMMGENSCAWPCGAVGEEKAEAWRKGKFAAHCNGFWGPHFPSSSFLFLLL